MAQRYEAADCASLARAQDSWVLLALLVVSVCIVDLGFTGPQAIAQDSTALTLEREKAKAANPGSNFKECANCPVMLLVPAAKFIMGSPEDEPGRKTSEGPRHEVTIAEPFAVSKLG